MRLLFLLFFCLFVACSNRKKDIPGPVSVVVSSYTEKVSPNDSTYLKIELQSKICKISLLNDSLATNDFNEIDKFIMQHKQKINTEKVFLLSRQKVDHDKFRKLKIIMKKNELLTFKMATNQENGQ